MKYLYRAWLFFACMGCRSMGGCRKHYEVWV